MAISGICHLFSYSICVMERMNTGSPVRLLSISCPFCMFPFHPTVFTILSFCVLGPLWKGGIQFRLHDVVGSLPEFWLLVFIHPLSQINISWNQNWCIHCTVMLHMINLDFRNLFAFKIEF